MFEVIAGILIGALFAGVGFYLITKNKKQSTQDVQSEVTNQLKAVLPEILSQSSDDLIRIANEKLGAEKKEIKTDMENKRGEIERLIKVMQQDLKDSKESLNKAEKERIGSYEAIQEKLKENRIVTDQLKTSTDNLKNLLSNNQLRGQFGEQVAEELLQMTGFVKGKHYDFNKKQSESETRPDFSIFLPDGKKINVDAKFPYSNLQKASETDDKVEKERYWKAFEQDVKTKIKQVVSRDYINPADNTVDFVILFIPNEMIFSVIYDRFNDLWKDAMEKKVILAGPFSFTAILRMVYQAYDNFTVAKNVQEMIAHVGELKKQFGMFSEEFNKVGSQIERLNDQYEKVNGTRFRQISKAMDKVMLEGGEDEVDAPQLFEGTQKNQD